MQRYTNARPLHLVPRHPQEVSLCDLVFEYDWDDWLRAVVVRGPLQRVVALVGGDAPDHRRWAHGSAFPLQEEGPIPIAPSEDGERVGMGGSHPVAVTEEFRSAARLLELDDMTPPGVSLLLQDCDQPVHRVGVLGGAEILTDPAA